MCECQKSWTTDSGVPLQVPMSGCALSQAGVRVTGGLVICKQLFAARRRRRRRRKILAFFVPKCGKSCKSCPREAVCERLQSPQSVQIQQMAEDGNKA